MLVAQSCPTLYEPMDCSPQVPLCMWSLQARMLEWVAISFPNLGIKLGSPALQKTL